MSRRWSKHKIQGLLQYMEERFVRLALTFRASWKIQRGSLNTTLDTKRCFFSCNKTFLSCYKLPSNRANFWQNLFLTSRQKYVRIGKKSIENHKKKKNKH